MAITSQSPAHASSIHSQSRSGECRVVMDAPPPHGGMSSPRKNTLRCSQPPVAGSEPVNSKAVNVVNTPGS